ncbi:MAG: hydantoinase B/oxoprolinase family protein [Candidatus Obscuribacterales bacterium]|nr:hydantoinase B/oxoprolinase family protein [Candidatus Obscuribacterales bacterium]
MNAKGWQFWIDRGGTFTDVVALTPGGMLLTRKLLSVNPAVYPDAALHAIETLLHDYCDSEAAVLDCVKMGTTIGTNALLERRGEPTVLVTTKGFGDALRIGYQSRPDIFALKITLPDVLYSHVVEVNERISAAGIVLERLDQVAAREELQEAFSLGFRSCAILLMHGYRYDAHEKILEKIAQEIGFEHVSCSHIVSPLIKFVGRGDTTLADAYLSPLLKRYTKRVRDGVQDARLMFMQSNGGLTDAENFTGKDSLLSGPAGGLTGAVKTALVSGFEKLVTFDMGGTSTDVSHYSGDLEYNFETNLAGIRMRSPILDIHTVAAGGGSILHFDGSRLRAGPESAGALPGPMSYRNGGPLTVSDANLLLGKIQPDFFPRIFGSNSDQPLDVEAVQHAFAALAVQVGAATSVTRTAEQLAEGFLQIAVTRMANAIKKVSVQRGHDVSSYVLSCFGGAGGQHACLIAESLGIKQILIHPLAGVLSALGIGLADVIETRELSVNSELSDDSLGKLKAQLEPLTASCRQTLIDRALPVQAVSSDIKVLLRYENCDFSLPVDFCDESSEMLQRFSRKHLERYGFVDTARKVAIDSVSIRTVGASLGANIPFVTSGSANGEPVCFRKIFSHNQWREAGLFRRSNLSVGQVVSGPAILAEDTATTILEPGWEATVLPDGSLLLSSTAVVGSGAPCASAIATAESAWGARMSDGAAQSDPVKLELFNSLFMFIAEEMGLTLQNTSYSVNIKERLDFSCAIFDQNGNLIANAPHIPVHLGSMGESVKNLLKEKGALLKPGDVYATNDPFNGGTHLPDITVITPVFSKTGGILFFCASRGHHADIGGITPGSMPPGSKTIEEEGILLTNCLIVEGGEFQQEQLLRILRDARYPARNPNQNLSDLKAQIAANARGLFELNKAAEYWGLETLQFYMAAIQDNAEECVRRAIEKLGSGSAVSEMDDGSRIVVDVRVDKAERTAVVDFSGTSAQHSGNLNAPHAVALAAVLYVFRTIVDDDIPLNAGCFRPLNIIIPQGCMLNPKPPAAVVAGNVETSQQIVDALYAAIGVMAASQGTMNNFTFGDSQFQYYETICGGAGAGRNFSGTDAVHTHMTNSRLTDPEVLENRFPVLLQSFAIRRGSGGKGQFQGGCGVVRRIKFLQPMTASILSERRRISPPGLFGGECGAAGSNYVVTASGQQIPIKGSDSRELEAGDVFVIETPGGGGFGRA